MSGFQNDAASEDTNENTRSDNLRAARPYGCLFAVLLGLAMSFIVFLGTVMGDCVAEEPDCHSGDGLFIMQSLAVALPIAAFLGACMWLVATALRTVLRPLIPDWLIGVLLVGLTLFLVWLSFDPAFEVFFALTSQP